MMGWEVRRRRSRPFRPLDLPVEPRTLLDVGAADGTPELYDAYPDALIVAFDPLIEQLDLLRKKLNPRECEPVQIALGKATGRAELAVDQMNLFKSSLHPRTALTRSNGPTMAQTVSVRALDDLVRERGWAPPFILKIDTEGHELEVLEGAMETLMKTAAIYCETSVAPRFEDGYRFSDIAAFLIASGFELCDVLAAPRLPDGRTSYLDCVWIPRTPSGRAGVRQR